MKGRSESAMDENDDDLFGEWFERGELGLAPEAAPQDEGSARGSRVGIVVAAVSATVLTLVIVFAGRV
jgi:hypothetical protein